jgi:hypothetical protein
MQQMFSQNDQEPFAIAVLISSIFLLDVILGSQPVDSDDFSLISGIRFQASCLVSESFEADKPRLVKYLAIRSLFSEPWHSHELMPCLQLSSRYERDRSPLLFKIP